MLDPTSMRGELRAVRKIVAFNVKYSPNLGDGVIAACIESELAKRFPHAEIKTLDLAGRTERPTTDAGGRRVLLLRTLNRLPGRLREIATELALRCLVSIRCVPLWRKELCGADCVVFGGGQLIQDQDLNFPVKLAIASREARRFQIPCSIYAVGVARVTSARAQKLVARFLSKSHAFTSARDSQSVDNLRARGAGDVVLAPDPALLAANTWPRAPHAPRVRARIGLCITHPAVLHHHGSVGSGDDLVAGYEQLISDLLRSNYDVACFTNGAHEDDLLLGELVARTRHLDASGLRVCGVPRPKTPEELAQIVAACDGIIAHRLHACILAYAYRIPNIGLVWDSKLTGFFADLGRIDYTFALLPSTSHAIVMAMRNTLHDGIDVSLHGQHIAQAERGMDALARGMADAVRARAVRAEKTLDDLAARPMAWI
ncbi:polysaccharide pyruvyl transferase [Variibacter gotjawalensis]|uniref:Polysaccharide pyruvyl transferase n=2 Tax=Variibacter gotjawalensis TaxID=1333996 RepID=A0A0S3PZU7_9BRAD|nr:polysaccharide pyruvyl transferase WcaK-like protein [Variibacter gotjawalensis]BAT61478.1 polysaccharide pyruvyl transferase [Variibacter gotjawalensis]